MERGDPRLLEWTFQTPPKASKLPYIGERQSTMMQHEELAELKKMFPDIGKPPDKPYRLPGVPGHAKLRQKRKVARRNKRGSLRR